MAEKPLTSNNLKDSPAELDSEPGTGYVFPAALQRCSPLTRRRWPSRSAGNPSVPRALGSTGSPPPGSCDVTGQAPPRAPARSHRSDQRQREGREEFELQRRRTQHWSGFSLVPQRRGLHLQQTVAVDQQVSRFDVSVQDPSRVKVLQT